MHDVPRLVGSGWAGHLPFLGTAFRVILLVTMSNDDLPHNLGFDRDPFAKTNADEEELLESYFIEPPFFKAVYGDIEAPKSAVVYAPRGGGKTALKRRIELSARTEPFLCVIYNSFPYGRIEAQGH
jgi:hypothetical protein